MSIKKLAIITTHPIQYNAPWFRLLAERNKIQLKVFYTWSQSETGLKYDPGFGKKIEWDILLTDGYEYEFVENIAIKPGTRTHNGIVNPQLIERISQYHPNAILVNGWNFNSHLKCLKYFHKRIPVLFRGDSTLLNDQKCIRKLARQIILTSVYKNVDYGLYVGTQNKKYFLKHGLKEDQLIFVPHAIDNQRFIKPGDECDLEVQKWKKDLGIDRNKIVFLYAGKFEDVKNPLLIIEGAKLLLDTNVHFLIVGNGPQEELLKKEAGINVSFLEFQNQKMMPVLYRLGNVLIMPSKSETWGLSVNEAMACAKPVLVSDKCGCAIDLVQDGINGFVFQSGNVNDLVEKIKMLTVDQNNLVKMGDASLQKIQSWSFEKIARGIENLLEKI